MGQFINFSQLLRWADPNGFAHGTSLASRPGRFFMNISRGGPSEIPIINCDHVQPDLSLKDIWNLWSENLRLTSHFLIPLLPHQHRKGSERAKVEFGRAFAGSEEGRMDNHSKETRTGEAPPGWSFSCLTFCCLIRESIARFRQENVRQKNEKHDGMTSTFWPLLLILLNS